MHIAICDDNIADRKHLERLLSRESEKRAGTPNILFVDSFGNETHFLNANLPMYDLFFIDMGNTPTCTERLVKALREMGITASIILYSSKIDYQAIPDLPDDIVFMKKPYIPDPLPELLLLGDSHVKGYIETIALHLDGKKKSFPAHDIFYIYDTKEGKHMLYSKEEQLMEIDDTINDMQFLLSPYHEYYRISKSVIINMKLVTMITPFSVMMQDYKQFLHSPLKYSEMQEWKMKIDEEE